MESTPTPLLDAMDLPKGMALSRSMQIRGITKEPRTSPNRRQACERHGDFFRRILVVFQFAGLVVDVGLHVEVTMAAEVEENGARLAFRFGFEGLADGFGDGVVGFGRGHDAFGAGKLNAGSECIELLHGGGFGQAEIDDMRDQRRHAVIAQAAGVNSRRNKGAAQGVHLDQRRQMAGVAEVVSEAALGEAGAGGGLHGHDARVALALELAAKEGHDKAGKVRSAAGAADDDVGLVAGQRHLLDGFLADDGLVEQHVIQHAAERVLGLGSLAATSTASEMAMPSEPLESGCWARMARPDSVVLLGLASDRGAEGFNECAAIGLLVVADAHHEDLALEAEEGAGHGQRGTPLAGAGLSGKVRDAFLLVVPGLRDGGVELVRAGGADAFIFVINARRRIESLLKPARANERRRTPLRINLPHLFRNLDLALGADFLHDERHGKQRRQIFGADAA